MLKVRLAIVFLVYHGGSFSQFLPPGVIKVDTALVDVTEVTNLHWLEYLHYLKKDSSELQLRNALPDTTVWAEVYENPLADAFIRDYLRKEGFKNFPVVGVNRAQAKNYCRWRTAMVNAKLKKDSSSRKVRYFLPTPNQWFAVAAASHSYKVADSTDQLNKMKFLKTDLKEIILKSGSDLAVVELKRAIIGFYSRNPILLYENLSVKENFTYKAYLGVGAGPKRSLSGGTLSNIRGNVSELTSVENVAMGGNWTLTYEQTPPDLIIKYNKPSALLGFRCLCRILSK